LLRWDAYPYANSITEPNTNGNRFTYVYAGAVARGSRHAY
jgi:hypothetical protein